MAETTEQRTARLKQLRLAKESKRKPTPRRMVLLKLDDELRFGKHVGKTVEQVIEEDPYWLIWLLENSLDFELDSKAEAELKAVQDPRRPPKAWE